MLDVDLLIKQARISDSHPLVDVCVQGGRISQIAVDSNVKAEETIEAAGRVVLPGFVEPHLHLDKACLYARMPAIEGTLEEAIRITGILKSRQERNDVLARSRRVLDLAVQHGTTAIRAHPDVDLIQGLIGVETLMELRDEYKDLVDLQIVAFPQEGVLKSPGAYELMSQAMQMGADVVGGCPYAERTADEARRQIDMIFELAEKHDADLDIHADFSDDVNDPRFTLTSYLAEKTIERGFRGRISLGHVTSLGALDPEELKPIVELLRQAEISVVALPATDIYLSGRKDRKNPRRGLAPVRALHAAGVNVTYSSNNIRNAFTPFGKADMLLLGNMLAHVAQFGTQDDQATILRMATSNAARAIGIDRDYGLEVGKWADLVVMDCYEVADVLTDIPARSWVIKRGKITVITEHICKILRHSKPQTGRCQNQS